MVASRGRFAGKVVVVTGGGQGIGRATAQRFAEEGAAVVVADRDAALGQGVAAEIQQAGGQARAVTTDVADEASIQALVAQTVAAFGGIDILISNAAVFVLRGIEATVDEWRQILDVNVIGVALAAKHVVPEMRKRGGGAIVNLGSISSFIAQPQFVTYNATKGAIAQMTRCMAMDLAPDNIRVNAVCPGTVWTQIVESRARERGLDRAAADRDPDFGRSHMIERCADPVEIANAILFLASDEASFITAENLMVDGGYVAR
ncbi:MAG: SDR family oxidoreductase [Planctomycetaceae bacterium]|nr:SDR family oxidoreductase [Planctomycetaceae bacterium]